MKGGQVRLTSPSSHPPYLLEKEDIRVDSTEDLQAGRRKVAMPWQHAPVQSLPQRVPLTSPTCIMRSR